MRTVACDEAEGTQSVAPRQTFMLGQVARALRDFELVGGPSFGVGRAELLLGYPAHFRRGARGQPRVAVLHGNLTDLSTFPLEIHLHSDRLNLKTESVILASEIQG